MTEYTMSGPTGNGPELDWTHILVETASLDDVKGVFRGSTRLRFTSIDVSSKYLVLGSNTGSVYVFGRTSFKHPQIIVPEVDPAQVNNISISPVEKTVAFSTVKGHVLVYEITDRRQKPEKLRLITDHVTTMVTSVIWDATGSKLYTGDSNGRIFVTSVPTSKVQNLVALPPEIILRLDSSVCQVDFSEDKLLVSTLHKCYLCYTTKQKFTNIGSKPRDGEYGACFHRQPSSGLYKICCARPGSRIWEVDIEGNVLNTHMFKQLLAIPALPIVSSVDYSWQSPLSTGAEAKGLAFPRLKTTRENFLFSWVKNNLYILDPVNVKVIFWTDLGSEIQNIVSSDNFLFIIYLNGNIQKTKIYPIPQCVSLLISKKSWQLAITVANHFQSSILKMRWRKYLSITDLEQLKEQCKLSGTDLFNNFISSLIETHPTLNDSESDLDSSFSDRSRSSSSASTQKLDVSRVDGDPSFLSPEIRSIPDDYMSSPIHAKNAELDDKKSRILDLIDSAGKDIKMNPPTQQVYQAIHTVKENSLVGEDREHSFGKLPSLGTVAMQEENAQIVKNELYKGTDGMKDLGGRKENALPGSGMSLNNEGEIKAEKQFTVGMDYEENPQPEVDIFQEDLKPVIALQSEDISPLVVSTSSKKKKPRKKSVNDILFEGGGTGTANKGMRRSKSLSSISKSLEKKLTSKQSLEEPLVEETVLPPRDVSTDSVLDLVVDTRSLGGESLESSSPSSSLAQSWESTGSEKLAEFRKKSMSKLDSVQSTIANTKNKLLKAIKTKARPKEGKSTPDTLSLDSVDGVIIAAEKVQKEIIQVAPVVQGPIDLTDLQKSTERTRMMLQDINILMNPTELQKTLSDWVKDLNQSLCRLHTFIYVERLRKFHKCKDGQISMVTDQEPHYTSTENITNSSVDVGNVNVNLELGQGHIVDPVRTCTVQKPSTGSKDTKLLVDFVNIENLDFKTICHLSDPFLVDQNFREQISELTQMCFDCGCHGNIADFQFPSLQHLENTVICEKCNEKLNTEVLTKLYEKGSIYKLHQRDSGYSDYCDKKKELKETVQEQKDLQSEQNAKNIQNKSGEAGDIVKSKDVLESNNSNLDQGECEGEEKTVTVENICTVSVDSGILVHDDTIIDKNKSSEQTGLCLKESMDHDDMSDELESFSGPQSCTNSDSSFPSLPVEDFKQDSVILETNNLSENTEPISVDVVSMEMNKEPETEHIPPENTCNSCLYCHLCHVTCFHANMLCSAEKDRNVTLFVQYYYFLLKLDSVKSRAYSSDDSSFPTWCGLVKCIQACCKDDRIYNHMEQELSATTELLRLGEFQQSKILGYLSRLFELKPDKAITLCVESSAVRPEDVLNFCTMYSLQREKYFYQFMRSKVTNSDRLDSYQNTVVVETWLELLLKATDMSEKVFDERKNPRPWSHLLQWKDQNLIDSAMNLLDDHMTKSFCDLCRDVGYWPGHLTLLKRLQKYRDMLVIIIYLQDLTLLDSKRPYGFLPNSIEDWKWFIDQYDMICQQQRPEVNGESSNLSTSDEHEDTLSTLCTTPQPGTSNDQALCSASSPEYDLDQGCSGTIPITWDTIGQLMIQKLGPVTTVKIIEDCGKANKQFSPAFFQSCVLSSFLHRQQRNITHSMLEKLDSYLWTKKPVTLMPELQFLVSSEREGTKVDKQDSQDNIMYVSLDPGLVNRQYREDMETHWGTSTKINRCCKNCNIKLTETISHVEPGVIVFPCGHGFHKFCCPLRECILCADME